VKYCDEYIGVYVCLSVCLRGCLQNHTSDKFFVHVAYGHGLVILRRRCNTLCTSDFVDDVMFFTIMGSIEV